MAWTLPVRSAFTTAAGLVPQQATLRADGGSAAEIARANDAGRAVPAAFERAPPTGANDSSTTDAAFRAAGPAAAVSARAAGWTAAPKRATVHAIRQAPQGTADGCAAAVTGRAACHIAATPA